MISFAYYVMIVWRNDAGTRIVINCKFAEDVCAANGNNLNTNTKYAKITSRGMTVNALLRWPSNYFAYITTDIIIFIMI